MEQVSTLFDMGKSMSTRDGWNTESIFISDDPDTPDLTTELVYATETLQRFVRFFDVLVAEVRSDLAVWSAYEQLDKPVPKHVKARVRKSLLHLAGRTQDARTADNAALDVKSTRTARDSEIVQRRVTDGWSYPRIGAHFGISKSLAFEICKRAGVA